MLSAPVQNVDMYCAENQCYLRAVGYKSKSSNIIVNQVYYKPHNATIKCLKLNTSN